MSQIQYGPFIRRFLRRLPADVARSFTADQLHAVERAFGMRYTMQHGVDLRRSLLLPWGRFYMVLLAGRDERADAPAPKSFAPYAAAATAVGACGAVLMLVG